MKDEGFEPVEVTQENCEDYLYQCIPSTRTQSGEIAAEARVRMAEMWTWPGAGSFGFPRTFLCRASEIRKTLNA